MPLPRSRLAVLMHMEPVATVWQACMQALRLLLRFDAGTSAATYLQACQCKQTDNET
jgi:hypothetical protein